MTVSLAAAAEPRSRSQREHWLLVARRQEREQMEQMAALRLQQPYAAPESELPMLRRLRRPQRVV